MFSFLLLAALSIPSFAVDVPAVTPAVSTASAGGLSPDERMQLGAKAIRVLAEALGDEDPETRIMAAQEWGNLGNRAILGALRKRLKDPNRYVRIAAASSLHELGDPSGIPALEAIIRLRSAKAKGGKGPADPVEQLRDLARNKIRVAAIRALSMTESTDALKTFEWAKADPDGFVRDAAAVALARLGEDQELDRFVQALDSQDPGERLTAVRRLGDSGLPGVLPYLKRMAADPDAPVRAAAMQGLGGVGQPEGMDELTNGIRDADNLVRSDAIEAMGRMRVPSVLPILKSAYEMATTAYVKLLAAQGLARLGADVDLGLAQRSLAGTDMDTRLLAVEVVEAAGGDTAMDILQSALQDSNSRVRVRASGALVRLLRK